MQLIAAPVREQERVVALADAGDLAGEACEMSRDQMCYPAFALGAAAHGSRYLLTKISVQNLVSSSH